jgi:hypothetical protein
LDFIMGYVLISKNLEFLVQVGDDLPHQGLELIDGLPSWVPDWSRRNTAQRLAMGFASGCSGASYTTASGMRLAARGVGAGSVDKTHKFGHDLLNPANTKVFYKAMHATLQAVLPRRVQLQTTLRNAADRKEFQQVVRVLTNDTYAEHHVPISRRPKFQQVERHVIAALWDIDPGILSRNTHMCFFNCLGRSLFATSDGKIGLGPNSMQEDDVLAILLSCPTVMILRPLGTDHHYRVIGNAICSGFMDGEAILGSLPGEYETVSILNETSGTDLPAFRNRQTGQVTHEDPRLPLLKPEWKDVSVDRTGSNASLCWRNETTGEWRYYLRDPRLDTDALESRGVKLETFFFV